VASGSRPGAAAKRPDWGRDEPALAAQTLAFELERLPGFDFKVGQFAEITWIDPPEIDDSRNSRSFTITSAPEDRRLTFGCRKY
jgi:ferredoxin-NADP reductase